jgi:hypothetical protein
VVAMAAAMVAVVRLVKMEAAVDTYLRCDCRSYSCTNRRLRF